ncbi:MULTISPECIES: CRISPR-associated helicase/endonuclease Cas3 [unclassified Chelatococcus]|uniref:CRISPR-associated helicase/endonuclease Cas3 n=1 Tax=unclassified Chelatococcus TaxID=2638111 RepID=UPI0002F3CE89|nr:MULTISPECIES: CRISPR-associated helicase/endonuclease Cas3 [unclassified Chelatococcus]ALA16553.1 CRISPR-associated protein Cas3 [Chelatococcus sp. CO-6]
MYYAHSTEDGHRGNWQPLREHLEDTAVRAAAYGAAFKAGKAARLAALLHDLGKYTPGFAARLDGSKVPVDHSTAGAALVLALAKGDDRLIGELIAYVIAGHHAGLPDKQGESLATLSERLKGFSDASLDPVWRAEIAPDASGLVPAFRWEPPPARGAAPAEADAVRARLAFQFAFLGRMLFSCLVDADFKDTEGFYCRVEGRQVDRAWPALQAILPELLARYARRMEALGSRDTMVNSVRSAVLDHVLSRAGEAPGLFTLTVPTGGGKTLASLGFALDHARIHGHRRIIYAIPFTSIIDQTAAIFRELLGGEVVLEHHSAIDEARAERAPAAAADSEAASRNKLRLAMEDWAAPVVVTTNVQLFESLLAARPGRCRKLHNIAGSIIILDEAQTLPRPLLAPAVAALRELATNYGCSIVLCTATQPALDAGNFPAGHPVGLPLAGRELAPEPQDLARKLRRVTLRFAGKMDDAALVAALMDQSQGLVVVNSRKHALALYQAGQEAGLDGLVHLSTRQHAADRRAILADVRQRLKDGHPCRVIATSLVEAGVDLDFPRVWRAEAGLDNVAQAAGRCNREGRRPVDESIVTIFTAPDHPPPPEIKSLSGDLGRMADKHEDLLSPQAMEDFFGEVYWRVGPEGVDKKKILADFRMHRGEHGPETIFAYRCVAEKFRMIESGMEPVIVANTPEAWSIVERLGSAAIPSGALARELQPYIVQVPPKARALLLANGHVVFRAAEQRGDQFAVLMTGSLYRPDIGLIWEDAGYLGLEQWMV